MLALVAGSLVVSCASSQEEARAHAAKACADYGYGRESSDGSERETTVDEYRKLGADDSVADEAALAARKDSRWDRLSNAMTDSQEFLKQAAIASDETLPQEERDAARAAIERLNGESLIRTVEQECRKATA
ncbi:hypothetical protein [Streptomyces sp. NPDC002463]|uniref:hypothetical protein n=1 Tax=Streptomyces sp. NPDC002463 TaxID=3364645 RepID=UPI0036957E6B